MKKNLLTQITYSFLLVFYVVVGILTIVMSGEAYEKTPIFCGMLVLLSSIVHIVLYFLKDGLKNSSKSYFLVIGIVGLALGIIFMASDEVTIEQICFYWGILDIVRGALEIKGHLPEIKINKLVIVEILISLGDIILGILLCIHLKHGIELHLIYLGAAFIVSAINILAENLIHIHKTRKNK